MNARQLTAALESIGMHPGRLLGQNFLLDGNLLDLIIRLGAPRPGENILEVGPGFGALTSRLLASGAQIWSVEFDHRIAGYLRQHYTAENFHLVEADACRVDYRKLFDDAPFRCIANLPYSISSVFIARMLGLPNPPAAMLFMLQRETGGRLVAAPGCGAYGALSVRTQLLYRVKIERIVPADVFYPPPAVDSALVSFVRIGRKDAGPDIFRLLPGVVKTVFAQRRKQMGKVLSANFGAEKTAAALSVCGLPREIRPEKVSVEQFIALTAALYGLEGEM